MLKTLICSVVAATFALSAFAQKLPEPVNSYSINLNEVKDDKLTVMFKPKSQTSKTATFMLPRMVPGTYAIYDFSRFVSNVKAFNKKGKSLKVQQSKDGQSWVIKKAHTLATVSYEVEDTWDTDKSNVIFEPAGTNFDVANNVFVLNTHGVFGYLKGRESDKISITVDYPKELFGSSSLSKIGSAATSDIYKASNYHDLVDAPIMYALPDTATFNVGSGTVLIHTYSPTGAVSSKALLKDIQPIVTEQVKYLGNIMPVEKYAFIIFLNKESQNYLSGAAGALEHGRSSLYTLFEGKSDAIAGMVRDVSAHEFFHIVTPLFLHSEEIEYFDFFSPKMSKHLWLYEGYTEYCAQHMQTVQKLKNNDEFLLTMGDKLRNSKSMNDSLAFTDLSLGALDEHKNQYGNVYQKGALLCMALDMYLIQNSDARYNMRQLINDLSSTYTIGYPFKDADLFAIIEKTCRETGFFQSNIAVKQWLETYLSTSAKIDYAALMLPFGVLYEKEGKIKEISKFGLKNLQKGLAFDTVKLLLKIRADKYLDEFGSKDLGLKAGDLIKYWNGKEVTAKTVNTILGAHDGKAKKGDKLTIGILRPTQKDEFEELTLEATIKEIETTKEHVFTQLPNPTDAQLKLRKAWLNNDK